MVKIMNIEPGKPKIEQYAKTYSLHFLRRLYKDFLKDNNLYSPAIAFLDFIEEQEQKDEKDTNRLYLEKGWKGT